MDSSIKTITLKEVELQENGIIRLSNGHLIARLVDSVNFNQVETTERVEDLQAIKELKVSQPDDKFKIEIENLINKYSKENGSNTPDFILAEYLMNCLITFNVATNKRTKWYK